jgi:proteasome activator subunit 3 (PA28 gamma)
VYPSPNNGDGEPDTKKRRMDVDGSLPGSNDTMYARYLAQVRSNQHLTKVHDVVKRQCEELAKSCVSWLHLWLELGLQMPCLGHG